MGIKEGMSFNVKVYCGCFNNLNKIGCGSTVSFFDFYTYGGDCYTNDIS